MIKDFLLARITEDEERSQTAGGMDWEGGGWWSGEHLSAFGGLKSADAHHIAGQTPRRVLMECSAKRALIDFASKMALEERAGSDVVLKTLAAVYADHPDYQPEWAS